MIFVFFIFSFCLPSGKATPKAGKPMFIRQRTLAEYPISCVAKGSQ